LHWLVIFTLAMVCIIGGTEALAHNSDTAEHRELDDIAFCVASYKQLIRNQRGDSYDSEMIRKEAKVRGLGLLRYMLERAPLYGHSQQDVFDALFFMMSETLPFMSPDDWEKRVINLDCKSMSDPFVPSV
jgi:hypothetical protein